MKNLLQNFWKSNIYVFLVPNTSLASSNRIIKYYDNGREGLNTIGFILFYAQLISENAHLHDVNNLFYYDFSFKYMIALYFHTWKSEAFTSAW